MRERIRYVVRCVTGRNKFIREPLSEGHHVPLVSSCNIADVRVVVMPDVVYEEHVAQFSSIAWRPSAGCEHCGRKTF